MARLDHSPPLLSLCVPTLRGYDDLTRFLRSVERWTSHIDYEVIIVDSGSRTRGYTVPMNQALRTARGEIIMAFNDDVEVTEGWAEPMIEATRHTWGVCFPDQSQLEGMQCICGTLMSFRGDFLGYWGGYDERYVIWCSDIDLAKFCHDIGSPPVRVRIPNLLIHHGSQTTKRMPEILPLLDEEAKLDLQRYQEKWGTSALEDKHGLQAVMWEP